MIAGAYIATAQACKNATPAAADDAGAGDVQTPVTVTGISRDTMMAYTELNATSAFLLKSVVKSNANGYLRTLDIHLGQSVSKGQTLFTIRTKEAESLGGTINSLDSTFRFSGTNSIHASENGFITQLDHQPGDYVQDGEPLATISNRNSFVFLLNMPYELRQQVMDRKQVEVLMPDGEKLQGSISSVMPSVDAAAQTQGVVIKVNAGHAIPENLVAKVRILKAAKTNAVSLPRSAVLTDETQSNFWIMKMIDSVTAVKVPVQKGLEANGRVEIVSPVLSDKDRILITGNYGLADTAKVKVMN